MLLVDDLLATGGTVGACCRLVEKAGAQIAGCAFLIELLTLGVEGQLARFAYRCEADVLIIAAEARGFIFATPLALELDVGRDNNRPFGAPPQGALATRPTA